MPTVTENLQRIIQAKADIKTAINAKGGSLTNETIDEYATAINNLPSGAGGDNPYCEPVDSVPSTRRTLFSYLKSVTVPSGVSAANLSSFWVYWTGVTSDHGWDTGYTNVKKIDFSAVSGTLTSFPSYMFRKLNNEIEVIGNCANVTTIKSYAFYDARGFNILQHLIDNCNLDLTKITSIGTDVFFYYCHNVAGQYEVIVPNAVLASSNSTSSASFRYCQKLKKVYANSAYLRNVNEYCGATNLVEIIFGPALTAISFTRGTLGNFSANYPSHITTLRFKSTTPPSLSSSSAFDSSSHPNLVHIYVPAASVSAYQTATNWSQYASIISADPDE